MTNILQLPLLSAAFEITNNEDWRDAFAFMTAGAAQALPQPGIVGDGTLSGLAVAPGAPIGTIEVEVLSVVGGVTTFALTDPNGVPIGTGIVGTVYNFGGLSFTLTQGATAYVVGDAYFVTVYPTAIDLTGIAFHFALKTDPTATKAILTGSTTSGTLVNGGTTGTLGFNVPQSVTGLIAPRSYVVDIVAKAECRRRVLKGTVDLLAGITPNISLA